MSRQTCSRLTPLCHFVTSPPQGGRSKASTRLAVPRAQSGSRPQPRSNRNVDRIAGDPAGPGPISPLEREAHRIWSTGGGSGVPLSPRGEVPSVCEAMRGPPGPALALRAPLIRPCGPPSPRWGEEGARLMRRSESIGNCPALRGVGINPRSGAIDPANRLQRRTPAGQTGVTSPRTIEP